MNITIFGLGYVGSVCAGCLAAEDHRVIGVDKNQEKVKKLHQGESPVFEQGLQERIEAAHRKGLLLATDDSVAAVKEADLIIVCVGTPNQANGLVDLRQVYSVIQEIGAALISSPHSPTVVLRSTVPPGTSAHCQSILRAEAGHTEFHFAFCPEFLREGRGVEDFLEPALAVIGADTPEAFEGSSILWNRNPDSFYKTSLPEAELIKYVCNAYHATKVAFANEVGRIAKAYSLDGRYIMEIVCADRRLNISSAYLQPGSPFGGSCLPKDLRAMISEARHLEQDTPLIEGVQRSNEVHLEAAFSLIQHHMEAIEKARPSILLIGLAFKAGTDDLRGSPYVKLAKRLILANYSLKIIDPLVHPERLTGLNLAYVRTKLPEIGGLMIDDLEDGLNWADVVVIAQATSKTAELVLANARDKIIVDLSGLLYDRTTPDGYEGFLW